MESISREFGMIPLQVGRWLACHSLERNYSLSDIEQTLPIVMRSRR
jgi:hypothetical protein